MLVGLINSTNELLPKVLKNLDVFNIFSEGFGLALPNKLEQQADRGLTYAGSNYLLNLPTSSDEMWHGSQDSLDRSQGVIWACH